MSPSVAEQTNLPQPMSDAAFAQRDTLALLLSRLAAMQGQAVPAHRFAMQEHSQDGMPLADLWVMDQAREMWRARFASGSAEFVPADQLNRQHFPMLWVSRDELQLYLLRGRLSDGTLAAEDAKGQTHVLSTTFTATGQMLCLRPESQASADAAAADTPRSASDWFAFAIRKHRRVLLEAVFATLVISLLAMFASLFSMQVYDRVIPTKGFSTLVVLTVGVLLAIALEFTMKQVRAYMVDRATKQIDLELSGVFFGKALAIRMDARPPTVGTFASQIRHFESVRNFMTSTTLFVLADAPFALLFIGVIGALAGPVALVPLVTVPLAVLSGLMFTGAIARLSADNMAESNKKNGLLIEAVDGIESVKAAGGEWKMHDAYTTLTAKMGASEIALRMLSTRASNISQVIQQVNYAAMVAVGAYAITTGQLTMGGLIACSIISGRALSPLAQIPSLIVQWQQAKVALKSLDGIMAMPGDRAPDQRLVVPERCTGELRLEKVAFGYLENRPSLSVADLSFKPGERVAIVGAVGSGKSTLIKLLSGLYKPKEGTVFLDGVDMQHLAPEFVREHIGYLPQDVRLFSGTLRENLCLGLPTPSDSRILQAAQLTGLDAIVQQHPKGLELDITEGGRGLSGGQRQLVGLTRLLLARPKIMLLDEPTASMDARLEAQVMRHLFEVVPPDSVLLVVTHKPALLRHVQRVIVVDKGAVVFDGPRDKMLTQMQQGQSGTAHSPPAAAASATSSS